MANLFEKNSYLKEFESKIINVNKEKKTIELEDTAFYAKGGGQPGDNGIIEIENQILEVIDTIKDERSIINIVEDVKNAENNKKSNREN